MNLDEEIFDNVDDELFFQRDHLKQTHFQPPHKVSEAVLDVTTGESVTFFEEEEDDFDFFSTPSFVIEHKRILENMTKSIPKYQFSSEEFTEKQVQINFSMRQILLDWLCEVFFEFKLRPQTLFRAINILDRVSSKVLILKDEYQLVGGVCMFMAAKLEEVKSPNVKDYVWICDYTYSEEHFIDVEKRICELLDFDVLSPVSFEFLSYFLQLYAGDVEVGYLAVFLCLLLAFDSKTYDMNPKIAAVCSVLVAGSHSSYKNFNRILHQIEFEKEDLLDTIVRVSTLFSSAKHSKNLAAYVKFADFGSLVSAPALPCSEVVDDIFSHY
eukprot:TRINITY_DN1745_c0_g1_i1.p1 TRINITY_DN1745_c0_g1~~TRINITY_DN1745_c0_g1_i1.p1  ORF type:complete len:326 (+),score=112.80 TRINITY_DN1745_c0_g1_i1:50-1027(+)